MRWLDRTVGIVLGIVLGLGIVTVFVFEFSEDAVDAPSLSAQERSGGGAPKGSDGGDGVKPATVRVVGGLPPDTGPPQLVYEKGELARIRILSDGPVTLELQGYGDARSVPGGRPTLLEFQASKVGNFALLSGTIAVAQIRVTPKL